jgi:hypothetical protein
MLKLFSALVKMLFQDRDDDSRQQGVSASTLEGFLPGLHQPWCRLQPQAYWRQVLQQEHAAQQPDRGGHQSNARHRGPRHHTLDRHRGPRHHMLSAVGSFEPYACLFIYTTSTTNGGVPPMTVASWRSASPLPLRVSSPSMTILTLSPSSLARMHPSSTDNTKSLLRARHAHSAAST